MISETAQSIKFFKVIGNEVKEIAQFRMATKESQNSTMKISDYTLPQNHYTMRSPALQKYESSVNFEIYVCIILYLTNFSLG